MAAGGTMDMRGGTISGFTDFTGELQGAAIYNEGTLAISGGTITDNKAVSGGAIFNSGTMTISGGSIENCTAEQSGGAIYNNGELTLDGATIKDNTAKNSNGGAIYSSNGIEIKNSTISGNSAQNGGAVFLVNTAQLTNRMDEVVPTGLADQGDGWGAWLGIATAVAAAAVTGALVARRRARS